MVGGNVDPAAAWAAASAAVDLVMGEPPPSGRLKPGNVKETALSWRRQVAIYTAAVSLNVGVKPLLPFAGVQRRTVRVLLNKLETLRDNPAVDDLLDLLGREAARRLAGMAA